MASERDAGRCRSGRSCSANHVNRSTIVAYSENLPLLRVAEFVRLRTKPENEKADSCLIRGVGGRSEKGELHKQSERQRRIRPDPLLPSSCCSTIVPDTSTLHIVEAGIRMSRFATLPKSVSGRVRERRELLQLLQAKNKPLRIRTRRSP